MAEVRLKNITKQYDNKIIAVRDANLDIKDKEFMVLVGPSGCGKSTLLRMIAGLEEISDGVLAIDGIRMNEVIPKDRDIAMVFQNYALYPHMSVYDNMAFGLKLRKFPSKEIKKRVEDAADILGLSDLLDRKPKELSGGQRQRVAVGRAIIRKPKVFLFDEPLSNLDAKLRVQMRLEISKLHQQLGATMIYVTHDQTEAMTMGDRITVLKDGLIQQVDTPLNLYNYPVNHFVAGFIGSPAMNFFRGRVLMAAGSNVSFETDESSFELPDEFRIGLQPYLGQEIVMGIRPEHIFLSDGNNKFLTLKKKVEVTEPVGNETFFYFSNADITQCVRIKEGGIEVNRGDEVEFAFEKNRLYFFSPDDGNLLFTLQPNPHQ